MIKQIDARELPYLVYKKNNSYKIYTKGFTKREQVEEYLGEIRNYFPDAFVFTKNLPSFEIKSTKTDVNIVDGEIINHITDLLVLMDTQSAALYNYYKKEGNSELHVELLTKQQMILDNLSDTIVSTSLQNTIFDKNELESMIQHQENNIKHFENLLSNIENANMYKVHSLFLDSLFRVFDVVN
ncbi:MAG: hypothetical protein LR001_09570 [Clostridiales bacterium]|nr:hypothetical protein [Clostridiales bacterium]